MYRFTFVRNLHYACKLRFINLFLNINLNSKPVFLLVVFPMGRMQLPYICDLHCMLLCVCFGHRRCSWSSRRVRHNRPRRASACVREYCSVMTEAARRDPIKGTHITQAWVALLTTELRDLFQAARFRTMLRWWVGSCPCRLSEGITSIEPFDRLPVGVVVIGAPLFFFCYLFLCPACLGCWDLQQQISPI